MAASDEILDNETDAVFPCETNVSWHPATDDAWGLRG
jgi:hypothetical protein